MCQMPFVTELFVLFHLLTHYRLKMKAAGIFHVISHFAPINLILYMRLQRGGKGALFVELDTEELADQKQPLKIVPQTLL